MKFLVAGAALLCSFARADYVIVLNSADENISLIDPRTYREIKRVPVGKGPHHLMATPSEQALVLGNTLSNELVYLQRQSGTVLGKIKMLDPYQMAFSPDGKWFVATALRQDFVDIYEGEKIARNADELLKTEAKNLASAAPRARVKSGSMPSHLVFSSDSQYVYVTEQGARRISKIQLASGKLISSIEVGKEPAGIHLTPNGKYLLVGVMGENFVAVVDRASEKLVKKIVTGRGAHNIFPFGDKKHVLVSNRVDNTLSKVDQDTLEVVDKYNVSGGPDCVEIIPAANEMWVTSRWQQKVTVVDLQTKKIKASIPVGRSPHGIYYHAHAARQ